MQNIMQNFAIPVLRFSSRSVISSWQDFIFGVAVKAEKIIHCPLPDCGDESGVYYYDSRTGTFIGRIYHFDGQWWIDSDFCPPADPLGYEDCDTAETALILGYLVVKESLSQEVSDVQG